MNNRRKIHLFSFLIILSMLFGIVGSSTGQVLATAGSGHSEARAGTNDLVEAITYLGSLGSAVTKTSGTTLDLITTQAVTAGDDIVVAVATDPNSSLVVTITDPAGNDYEQVAMVVNSGNVRTYLFAAYNVNPFDSGSTLTINASPAVTARVAVAALFRGLANSGALDQIHSGTGSSATPSSGATAATTQPDELLIGVIGTEGPVEDAAGTWDSSFTAGPRDGTSGTDDTNLAISLGFKIVSATGAYTASKSGVTSRDWGALIATFGTTGATAASFNILLGRPEDTSITANIIPDQDVDFYVEYGTAPATYTAQTQTYSGIANQPIEFAIENFSANTRYYYRMVYRLSGSSEWNDASEHSFITQRSEDSSFTFTITSDNHLGQYGGQTGDELSLWQVTLQNILADHPDFHIDVGDTFPMDPSPLGTGMTDAEAKAAYYFDRPYLGAITDSIPYFQVLGNHENEEGWNFDDVFTSPDQSLARMGMKYRKLYYPNPIPDSFYSGNTDTSYGVIGDDAFQEDYWAWEWGDALFVVIDPYHYSLAWSSEGDSYGGEGQDNEIQGTRWDWTLGIQQYLWFKSVLETSQAKYKFVFTHHVAGGASVYGRGGESAAPYFEWGGKNTDGTWAFDVHRPAADGWTLPIHQLMVENGVSIFFHGHDHEYDRELVDGIVYLETPKPDDAGYTWQPYSYGYNEDLYPNAIEEIQNSGYLRVNVSPSETTVEYVRSYLPGDGTNGVVADTVTIPGGTPNSYQLMVDKTGPGSGTVTSALAGIDCGATCSVAVSTGANVILTATPSGSSTFTGWGGDCSGTGACELAMNNAHVIEANFSTPGTTYSLTVNAGSNGSVTPAGTTTRNAGEVVGIKATPNSGYHFVNWTGDWGKIAHTTGASTSIAMAGNFTITANFAANTSTSYSLTVNATSGGSVSAPSSSPASYTSGTAVTLTASASPGYHFVNWTGLINTVADTKSVSTTVVMNGNYVIQANFAPDSGTTYTLTTGVSPGGGGIVSPVAGDHTYSGGTVVAVTATPASGYIFGHWSGACTGSGSCSVTMDADKTVTAIFEPVTGILGDVNGDGQVNSTDALIILSGDVGIPITQYCPALCGDINGDSLVNSTDALIILSFDVGMSVPFPVGQPGCPASVTLCSGCLP